MTRTVHLAVMARAAGENPALAQARQVVIRCLRVSPPPGGLSRTTSFPKPQKKQGEMMDRLLENGQKSHLRPWNPPCCQSPRPHIPRQKRHFTQCPKHTLSVPKWAHAGALRRVSVTPFGCFYAQSRLAQQTRTPPSYAVWGGLWEVRGGVGFN